MSALGHKQTFFVPAQNVRFRETTSDRVVIKAVKAVAHGEVWFERGLFRRVFIQSSLGEMRRQKSGFTSTEEQNTGISKKVTSTIVRPK